MSKLDSLDRIKQIGVIPAIRVSNIHRALRAAAAIQQGGIPIIEVSLIPPDAAEVLQALAAEHGQSILLGAGSVIDAEGVRRSVSAGAQFIVTPGFSPEAVAKAQELNVAMLAGALTPTEVQVAHASGADAVKLFPVFSSGGTRYLKALRGQYPDTDFIASGGVGLENCADYIRAGAVAIGVGGEIADAESMAAGDYRVFTVRAKRLFEAVRSARSWMEESASLNVGEAR